MYRCNLNVQNGFHMPRRRLIALVAALALPVVPAAAGAPDAPDVQLMGHRYALSRLEGGFESIAFHPVDRTLASAGKVRDLCGEIVSDGPQEAPGLAWDYVTETYWDVTSDAFVRRWDGDTLLDTVFAVPLTFEVPGWGTDSLESVRGLAADSTHVYFVDAGPDQGQIESNVWFKFTRSGDPVTSSRSTDFNDNLDADPDALVDDIVYVPHSAPVAPGLLLIALEHSGIQIIDTDGFFVDKVLWSAEELPDDAVLAAFAGLTIDPGTGDLYLVDNDTGRTQAWTRLPEDPAFYAVGNGGLEGHLQYPAPDCNRPLWRIFSPGDPPGTLFGMTYRSADQMVYGADFNSGALWVMDPRAGSMTEAGETGVFDIWGLAYDEERDLFYVGQEFVTLQGIDIVTQIYAVDPSDYSATALPDSVDALVRDLAVNPDDGYIYGVRCLSCDEADLIRIDRDVGSGTIAGPTACVYGLGYDPGSGRLIGIASGSCGSAIWSIDPATGDAEMLETLVNGQGWEGLAVVPFPGKTTSVDGDGARARMPGRIAASPNPFRAQTTIRLQVEPGAPAFVQVIDPAGRLVRTLPARANASGEVSVDWDGRTSSGSDAPAGVYHVLARTPRESATSKVIKLR